MRIVKNSSVLWNIVVLMVLVFGTTSLIFEASGKKPAANPAPTKEAESTLPVSSEETAATADTDIADKKDTTSKKKDSSVDTAVAQSADSPVQARDSSATLSDSADSSASATVAEESLVDESTATDAVVDATATVPLESADTGDKEKKGGSGKQKDPAQSDSSATADSLAESPAPALAVLSDKDKKEKSAAAGSKDDQQESKAKKSSEENPTTSDASSGTVQEDAAGTDTTSEAAPDTLLSEDNASVTEADTASPAQARDYSTTDSDSAETAVETESDTAQTAAPAVNDAPSSNSTLVAKESPIAKYPSAIHVISDKSNAIITWNDPESSAVTMIEVLRNSGGATPISGNPLAFISKGKGSFVDEYVTAGTTYKYQLRVKDSFNNRVLSAEYSVFIGEEQPLPVPALQADSAVEEDEDRGFADEVPSDPSQARLVLEAVVDKYLGVREKQGILESYASAFGRIPATAQEWEDVLRIATGLTPAARSIDAETRALGLFYQVFRRPASFQDEREHTALMMIAYGLRPAIRDLAIERDSLVYFIEVFQKLPETAQEWNILRAIAYYRR